MNLEELHKLSIHNKKLLAKSKNCGCFYCLKQFAFAEIPDNNWTDEQYDTALCPHCSVDAVLGDAMDVEITDTLLKQMHDRWF